MAVSLKKVVKVDLSKPELPLRVREYTPVHLLDEDETIHKSAASLSVDVSEVDTLHRYHKFKNKRYVYSALISLGAIACAVVLFLVITSLEVHGIFSIFASVLTNPIVGIGFAIAGFSMVFRFIREFTKFGGD